MGVVAVRALHNAFIDPMLHRHAELRAYRSVAAIAEFGLFLRQQEFRCRGAVNRMAIRADDVGFRVRRAADVGSGEILRVAAQALSLIHI